MYIDTHCHLDFPDYDPDREEVIKRAQEAGVGYIINIGSSLKGAQDSVSLADKYPCVYASVGIHPHEADHFQKKDEEVLRTLAKNKKVVAIGEIGLDYYKNYSDPKNQKILFTQLLQLAKDLALPVVIHSRQAEADIIGMLKSFMPLKAVIHCFSGDEVFLKNCLDLGFFVSFTCNITYRKAQNLRDVLKAVPLERLFLETDAPFLPPEGLRGKRNEPLYVKMLAAEVAAIKGSSVEEIAEVTTKNAKEFFKLSEGISYGAQSAK